MSGQMLSRREIKNLINNLNNLEQGDPEDILSEGHRTELPTYKGVMISKANSDKDKFKIDLLNMLQNGD